MNKRSEEFEISLINQPLDDLGSLLNIPETALGRAGVIWREARVIEGGMEGTKHEPD